MKHAKFNRNVVRKRILKYKLNYSELSAVYIIQDVVKVYCFSDEQ